MKPIKLRKDVQLIEYDPTAFFRNNEEEVISVLIELFKEGDLESFQDVLATYLHIINKEEFSRKHKIPIATLRRVCAGSTYNVETLFKILNGINKRISSQSKKAC
jgi:predicted transcriptional regulator